MSLPASKTESAPLRRWSALPLGLRIWGGTVVALAVLALLFGWFWRLSAEQIPPRQVVIRNAEGDILGQALVRPVRVPGQGVEFAVPLQSGETVFVQLPRRPRGAHEPPPNRPWLTGITGVWWLLGLAALAVAVGSYPVIRGTTQRLERLRRGVERWGAGDLSVRVPVQGSDEVAVVAERFNVAAERIEQLVAANRSLLANASHELRSPLARLRMAMELMPPGTDARTQTEIARNISELDQLIDEILLESRLEARQSDLGPVEMVELLGLVAEECAQVGAELEAESEAGAEADAEPSWADGAPVLGVPRLLRRVVRNLLENARRHSGDGPVTVRLRRGPQALLLQVCDRGPGVPADQRDRIFEPFYRLPGASEQHGGVGLGLALVRSIAERHGGQVRCTDHPDGGPGACFELRLPRGGVSAEGR